MKFKINEKLKEKGKTMTWLSEMTNITLTNISKLCKGENKSIKTNTIDKICTALDCKIEDILEATKHEKTYERKAMYELLSTSPENFDLFRALIDKVGIDGLKKLASSDTKSNNLNDKKD